MYSLIGAAIVQICVTAWQLQLAVPSYAIHPLTCLGLAALLFGTYGEMLFARRVRIKARSIVIDGAPAVQAERLLDHRVVALGGDALNTIFVLRIRTQDGRGRTRVIGLPPDTDLLQLDRAMRIMRRLARWRDSPHHERSLTRCRTACQMSITSRRAAHSSMCPTSS